MQSINFKPMGRLEYRDKRDTNGLLLKNKAYSLSHDFVDDCMKIISSYEVYSELLSTFNKEYIEFYFKKKIFYEFLPIAHQVTINEWDKTNSNSNEKVFIDISSFSCLGLLNMVNCEVSNEEYYIPNRLLYYFRQIKHNNKFRIKIIFNLVNAVCSKILPNYKFGSSSINKEGGGRNKISVLLTEGVDMSRRSSLFWLPDTNIDKSSLLIYFSVGNTEVESVITKLKKHNLQWVNIKKWYNLENHHLADNIIKSIRRTNSNDNIHKWLTYEICNLIYNVNYWYSFFKFFNIKVHSDNHEYGVDTLVKQIALHEIKGVSFNSQRSYLDSQKGKFYSYYPVDAFFAWGDDAAQRLKMKIINNDNPPISSIVISGCQQVGGATDDVILQIQNIKDQLEVNGAKTIVLFLDSNHSLNHTWVRQSFDSTVLKQLYLSLMTLLVECKEIAVIIKPKKMSFFESIYSSISQDVDEAFSTGRLHIVNDPNNVKPSTYARISDIVVGITSDDLPSSVVECAILNKPAIIYDYAGLSSVEESFYSWGNKKVIFNNTHDVICAIRSFVNESESKSIGSWSGKRNDFDAFCDHLACYRVGFYIRSLLKYFDAGLERKIVISMTNDAYLDEFGTDKIILSDLSLQYND